mgnify:CR=1 FL=1
MQKEIPLNITGHVILGKRKDFLRNKEEFQQLDLNIKKMALII